MKTRDYIFIRHVHVVLLLLLVTQLVYSQSDDSDFKKVDREDIEKVVNQINFGVPSSPALELLPDKPSEVVHLLSSRDIQTNIGTVFDGSKVLGGASFDIRPFVWFCNSLESYNRNIWERLAWRSVFALGTAADPQNNNDVLISAGLRLPIIDKGDPRTRLDHLRNLASAYDTFFETQGQPDFDISFDKYSKQVENVSVITDSIRREWELETWNAFRLELGIAGMIRARGRSIKADSLESDRLGLWLGAGFPLTKSGQLSLSGKYTWARTNDTQTEAARYSAGARARFFISTWLAGSLEGAGVWSRHKEGFSDLNDEWFHFAVIAEVKVPILNGWMGLTYGGDAGREGKTDSKFALTYAYYMNRVLSK